MTDDRFNKWVTIVFGILALLMLFTVQSRSTARSIDIAESTWPGATDSAQLLLKYFGTTTAIATGEMRTVATHGVFNDYDSVGISLPEEDSTWTVTIRIYYEGGEIADYNFFERIVPLWQLDDLAGNGLDTMILTAYDTGAAAGIAGATLQIETPAGVPIGVVSPTGSGGDGIFGLRAGDSYILRAFGPATKIYPSTKSFTATAGGVDTIKGYTQATTAAIGADAVSVFIDVGTGIIDSATGLMTIRDRVELTITTILENFGVAGGWTILPKSETKRPDAAGRVTFTVPANSKINPPGSYYKLTYRAFDGRSISTGTLRTFWLDTLPDPIHIDSTIEVWQ